jgi:hypothetical protein
MSNQKKRPLFPSELDGVQRVMFLALARSDMDMAAEACELGVRHSEDDKFLYATCCESAIVRYARPFCASNVLRIAGAKQVKAALGEDYIPKNLHAHAHAMHTRIMELRSSIVAHSDMRNRNFVLERLEKSPTKNTRWHVRSLFVYLFPQGLNKLGSMARAIQLRLMRELDDAADTAFPLVEIGQGFQVGGGDTAHIDALQKAWRDGEYEMITTKQRKKPRTPSHKNTL